CSPDSHGFRSRAPPWLKPGASAQTLHPGYATDLPPKNPPPWPKAAGFHPSLAPLANAKGSTRNQVPPRRLRDFMIFNHEIAKSRNHEISVHTISPTRLLGKLLVTTTRA